MVMVAMGAIGQNGEFGPEDLAFDPILLVYLADIHLWTFVGFLIDYNRCRI